MNPPERFSPDDPREWLNRAKSNLALAKNPIPGAYLEDLCFEAQQAAEKAIKATLIRLGLEFPYVHAWLACYRCWTMPERPSLTSSAMRRNSPRTL